jgi:4-amino-4-deoxy-L-arabinose transferase-like glycosyltransferase
MVFFSNKRYLADFLFLIFIAIFFRLPSFFLSHYNNDELIHLSLAKKIDRYGPVVFQRQQYNLFYIERGLDPKEHLMVVAQGERGIGSLLEGFLSEREGLSHHPPALPFFIAISHKIFANNSVYFINASNNIYLMLRNSVLQFYACIVPFLFSLFLILSVYLLGSLFFSQKIGFISALFFSLTPTELMTANKIWADDMVAFFAVVSVIFYLLALRNKKPFFSLLSGLICGISILAKMSGVYIIFVILLFHLFEHRNNKVSLKNLSAFIFNRDILYFLAGVLISSAWWFNLYYSHFDLGSAKGYFAVNEKWDAAKNWNSFFNVVSNRPWYSYFILIPFQFPLYILSYIFIPILILKNKIKHRPYLINKEARYINFLIIWIAVVFVFLTLKPGKELRYMLIAYPAIAILSVYCLNLFYEWLSTRNLGISQNLLKLFFISIILLSLFYSLKIALPRVLFRADIIPIPF